MAGLDAKTKMNVQTFKVAFSRRACGSLLAILLVSAFSPLGQARIQAQVFRPEENNPRETLNPSHNVVIELFYRGDLPSSLNAKTFLEQLQQRRPGIEIKSYDVLKNRFQLNRLWKLL